VPFFFDNSNDTKNIIFVNSGRLNVINSEFDWRLPQNWGNTIAIKLITILLNYSRLTLYYIQKKCYNGECTSKIQS